MSGHACAYVSKHLKEGQALVMDGPGFSNKVHHEIPAKLVIQSYPILTIHFTVTDISMIVHL